MKTDVLEALIQKDVDLRKQKDKIDEDLEKLGRMILGLLAKNGLDKAETSTHSVSVVHSYSLNYIDKKKCYDYLKKEGLWEKMHKTTFDAVGLKKYCTDTGDMLEGTVEISTNDRPHISSKSRAVKVETQSGVEV